MNKIIVIKQYDTFINVNNIQYCNVVNLGVDIVMANNYVICIPTDNPKKLFHLIKSFVIDNTENYVLEID